MDGSSAQLNSLTNLTMRCPNCRKLFSLSRGVILDEAASELRFECSACSTRFQAHKPGSPEESMSATWLDTFPELQPDFVSGSVSGVAVSAVEPVPLSRAPVMERDCPKCGSHQNASAKECRACGLVFEKFERTRAFALEGAPGEIRLEGRRELAEFWEQVLAAYDQEEMHQIFIRECDEANCLAFASAKYARILWANPHEEVAKKMRKRIIGLASIKMETVPSTRPWSFRILGMHGLAISLASATMTIGLMLPGQKNLAGIGFAWLALLIGARVMLRPPLR